MSKYVLGESSTQAKGRKTNNKQDKTKNKSTLTISFHKIPMNSSIPFVLELVFGINMQRTLSSIIEYMWLLFSFFFYVRFNTQLRPELFNTINTSANYFCFLFEWSLSSAFRFIFFSSEFFFSISTNFNSITAVWDVFHH